VREIRFSSVSPDALAVLNPEIQQAFESSVPTLEMIPALVPPPLGLTRTLASSAAGHVFSTEELFAIKKLIETQASHAPPSHCIQAKVVF